eukprot:TRINITY_DN26674_c0_g1_i1.p1 TRINITY_DN26674_c0_g1~~TRINITY_DN26674_c0_g1_i1.p1  ORF type:complete len:693 (-),score=58.03 TRINITY_DN26674_c0_g1_i1:383-2461(-)
MSRFVMFIPFLPLNMLPIVYALRAHNSTWQLGVSSVNQWWNAPPEWIEFLHTRGTVIGEGGYGRVVAFQTRCADEAVVVAKIPKPRADEKEIEKEIKMQKMLASANVAPQVYAELRDDSGKTLFMSERAHASMNAVRDVRAAKSHAFEGLVARFAYTLSFALDQLHARNLVHADLKHQNVLVQVTDAEVPTAVDYADRAIMEKCLDDACRFLLADFGAVASIGHTREFQSTESYLPPEVFAEASNSSVFGWVKKKSGMQHHLTQALDYWAFGLMLWELWHGRAWFDILQTENERYAFMLRSLLKTLLPPAEYSRYPKPHTPTVSNAHLQAILDALIVEYPSERINNWQDVKRKISSWLESLGVAADDILKPPRKPPCVTACLEADCSNKDHPLTQCSLPRSGEKAKCVCAPGKKGRSCREQMKQVCDERAFGDAHLTLEPAGRSKIGQSVSVSCTDGMQLNMEKPVLECTNDGWEGPEPFCTKPCPDTLGDLVVGDEDNHADPPVRLPGTYEIRCPLDTVSAPGLPQQLKCARKDDGTTSWVEDYMAAIAPLAKPCHANPVLWFTEVANLPTGVKYLRVKVKGATERKFIMKAGEQYREEVPLHDVVSLQLCASHRDWREPRKSCKPVVSSERKPIEYLTYAASKFTIPSSNEPASEAAEVVVTPAFLYKKPIFFVRSYISYVFGWPDNNVS